MNTYQPASVILDKKDYEEIIPSLIKLGFKILGSKGDWSQRKIINNDQGVGLNVNTYPTGQGESHYDLTRVKAKSKEEFLALCGFNEQSLEEREAGLIAKRDVINKELKEIREVIKANKPKIGDIGLFWNDHETDKKIGNIANIAANFYRSSTGLHYDHFEKLPEHLVKEIKELSMIKS